MKVCLCYTPLKEITTEILDMWTLIVKRFWTMKACNLTRIDTLYTESLFSFKSYSLQVKMTFYYFSNQCWHYTTLNCPWTRSIQHLHNARERLHSQSNTSDPSCSGKRKTVPNRKASGFQKCKRRPQEFSGVVRCKRDASSTVCSQCQIFWLQAYNLFFPEMRSFKFLWNLCCGVCWYVNIV